MRIIQYIPDFGLGGVQKAGCVLGRGLSEAGHAVWVVGRKGGPRLVSNADSKLSHSIAPKVEDFFSLVREVKPDVIHVHSAGYDEELVSHLRCRVSDALVVSTPVFGRPPNCRKTLEFTKTCCVGLYTFYRLCRWLRISGEKALHHGIAYAPLTPFEPASAEQAEAVAFELRKKLHGDDGGLGRCFVAGRIGRQDRGKWSDQSALLIDMLLRDEPGMRWLSVGYPPSLGLYELQQKWGTRFYNIPETDNYDVLAGALLAMDVQVFFSRQGECFAASICEAAGHAVPTIACVNPLRDNGQAEQVIDDVTGYLVRTASEATREIISLANDPARLARLRASTAAHAFSRWHYKVVADQVLSIYGDWGKQQGAVPSFLDSLNAEQAAFASNYRHRILSLYADNPALLVMMRLLLRAVETWPIFRFGGKVSRAARTVFQRLRLK